MKDLLEDSLLIHDLIDQAEYGVDLTHCAYHLNQFWRDHCVVKVTFLKIFKRTKHNHAAKGAWASLMHKYREKSNHIKGRGSWLND